MKNLKPAIPKAKHQELIQNALALHRAGKLAEAARQYQLLLNDLPANTTLLTNLGTIAFQQGNFPEAIKILGKSLQIDARQVAALNNRGMAFNALQQWDNALACFNRAIFLNPQYAEAYSNRGRVLKDLKRLSEALADFDRALKLEPGYAIAHYNRGAALTELNRLADALASYDRAIAINPVFAAACYNRGVVLEKLERHDEAFASFDRAVALSPNHAEAWCNRGLALMKLSRRDEAIASYERAIVINPALESAYSNCGNALRDLNRLEEALASYEQALAFRADYADAWNNRGIVLERLRRFEEAEASYDTAISLQPDFADAYWNKAYLKILLGEYAEGWRLYEWRWKQPGIKPAKICSAPLWTGEQSLLDKTLLIYPEQGLGDYLQFVRYALFAEQQGANVILDVPVALLTLISSLKGNFTFIEAGQTLPEFDYQCPIMTLPLAFNTVVETIPVAIPYLYADQAKQAVWRQLLGEKTNPRIGLVWSGSAGHKNDRNRSIALARFTPLLELPFEFHSLQKETRAEDAEFLAAHGKVKTHQGMLHDFADTAALLAEMDLVISVDTSVAHLAGALGAAVWIMLPYAPDYRWFVDRTDSPWYPTARLFRQPAREDWESVIAEICRNLENTVAR